MADPDVTRASGVADPAHELWVYEGLRVGHIPALTRLLDDQHGSLLEVADLYQVDQADLVTHACAVAFGGLPMFVWHSTFRAWLHGVLIGAGRRHGPRVVAADDRHEVGATRIVRRPSSSAGADAKSLADLPWTSWWSDGSWAALDHWLRARPLAEQEAVMLIDRLSWPADEARDALGWTDEHLRGLHRRVRADLAAQLSRQTGGLVAADEAAAGGVLAHLRATDLVADRGPVLAAFRAWRTERGISRGRRVAWLLRAGVRGPRAVLV